MFMTLILFDRENNQLCNVTHKPDLRTTNYVPEFPPICCLPSPLSSVTTTATVYAVVITAATVYVASAVSAVLDVAATFTITTTIFTVVAATFTITTAVFTVSAIIVIITATV
jgi:hypothetical protein